MSEQIASTRERGWLMTAAIVAVCAVAARIHNAIAFPPLRDFDGPAHVLSVFALYEGHLPDPRTWAGFHPPLYYALGAALWRVLPEAIPVHVALRLLSAAAGLGAVAIAWRTLRRLVSPADAAVCGALLTGAPVVAIATSMLGNETLCALFATAALARLVPSRAHAPSGIGHAVGTGVLAGLAALSKATGLGIVAVATLAPLLRRPRDVRAALATATPAMLLAAPFFVWIAVVTGSPLALISGGKPADAEGSEMAAQPPGERHLSDYVLLPSATLAAPFKDAPGMVRSVPGMLYASTWADGQGEFLPVTQRSVVGAAAIGALLGLGPTALAAIGLLALLRARDRRVAMPMLFGALLFAVFLVQTWVVPRYSAVKASYLLAALLPAAIALATGLATRGPVARPIWRALLLVIGAYGTWLTWWGWWR